MQWFVAPDERLLLDHLQKNKTICLQTLNLMRQNLEKKKTFKMLIKRANEMNSIKKLLEISVNFNEKTDVWCCWTDNKVKPWVV